MRLTVTLAAAAALTLAACNRDQGTQEESRPGDTLTAESIGGNDTTAIDAVTGDAANMAADVNYTFNDVGNLGEDANGSDNATDRNAAAD